MGWLRPKASATPFLLEIRRSDRSWGRLRPIGLEIGLGQTSHNISRLLGLTESNSSLFLRMPQWMEVDWKWQDCCLQFFVLFFRNAILQLKSHWLEEGNSPDVTNHGFVVFLLVTPTNKLKENDQSGVVLCSRPHRETEKKPRMLVSTVCSFSSESKHSLWMSLSFNVTSVTSKLAMKSTSKFNHLLVSNQKLIFCLQEKGLTLDTSLLPFQCPDTGASTKFEKVIWSKNPLISVNFKLSEQIKKHKRSI